MGREREEQVMRPVAKAAETVQSFRGPSNRGLEPEVLRAPCCWWEGHHK